MKNPSGFVFSSIASPLQIRMISFHDLGFPFKSARESNFSMSHHFEQKKPSKLCIEIIHLPQIFAILFAMYLRAYSYFAYFRGNSSPYPLAHPTDQNIIKKNRKTLKNNFCLHWNFVLGFLQIA